MEPDTTNRNPETPPAAAAPEAGKSPSRIYVGPNMGGALLLTRYSVFRNGFPEHLRQAMAADRELARLFVPVEELGEARKRLRDNASPLSHAFRSVRGKYREATEEKRGDR